MSEKLSAEKVISITILYVDIEGNRFSQSLEGGDAEQWLFEVEHRLGDFSLVQRLGVFPDFDWRYDYAHSRVNVDREPTNPTPDDEGVGEGEGSDTNKKE